MTTKEKMLLFKDKHLGKDDNRADIEKSQSDQQDIPKYSQKVCSYIINFYNPWERGILLAPKWLWKEDTITVQGAVWQP